ncbi:MAG TPA: NADH-quinone oxidoreductase subunit C, partial [Bacillota bacterium]|nr:NADH-quinone oxidoreductase subunit C [Bacillota bacterium]
ADGQAAGGSAPTGEAPATGAPAADDARAAAIAAAKAKAAAMAAARAAGQGGEAQAPAAPGAAPVEAAAGAPAADDARAAAIAAAKAKAAALAAARAQGGAAPGAGAAGAAPAAGAPAPAARPAPAPKAPPPPPPLDPALAPIKAFLEKTLTGVKFDDRTFRIIGIEVERDQLLDVAQKLRDMPETRCDYLACLSGVDYPDAIEVVYHLASTSTPAEVALRVRAPKAEGECHVESVTGLWAGANWHEREAFDLLGVRFDHHPDLRRILLPEGFAGGYPLRKDFKDAREQRERKVRVR